MINLFNIYCVIEKYIFRIYAYEVFNYLSYVFVDFKRISN